LRFEVDRAAQLGGIDRHARGFGEDDLAVAQRLGRIGSGIGAWPGDRNGLAAFDLDRGRLLLWEHPMRDLRPAEQDQCGQHCEDHEILLVVFFHR
jgi:hypothetical protein